MCVGGRPVYSNSKNEQGISLQSQPLGTKRARPKENEIDTCHNDISRDGKKMKLPPWQAVHIITNIPSNDSSHDKKKMKQLPPSKVGRKPPRRRVRRRKQGQLQGRWKLSEHRAFLKGLIQHGREWKKVAPSIPTRTPTQIRSHAQKYFAKIVRDQNTQLMQQYGVGDKASGLLFPHINKASVRQLALQIQANPRGAKLQVEVTLRLLTERYNELKNRSMESVVSLKDDASNGDSSGGDFRDSIVQHDVPEHVQIYGFYQ